MLGIYCLYWCFALYWLLSTKDCTLEKLPSSAGTATPEATAAEATPKAAATPEATSATAETSASKASTAKAAKNQDVKESAATTEATLTFTTSAFVAGA